MEWIDTKKEGYKFFKIDVNEQIPDFEWAFYTAKRKTLYTIDTWQLRTYYKRFTNIFLGDLAKNLFKSFIINQRPEYEKNIIEYDRIRTDDFKSNDRFDLKILNNDKEFNIEVKSSAEKISRNVADLLKRRIIINFGNQHQHFEWAVVQVMFVPKNLNFFKNENFSYENFEKFIKQYRKEFEENQVTAYIVGYADEEMQRKAVQKSLFSVKNSSASANERKYADLKIDEANSLNKFIDELDKIFRD